MWPLFISFSPSQSIIQFLMTKKEKREEEKKDQEEEEEVETSDCTLFSPPESSAATLLTLFSTSLPQPASSDDIPVVYIQYTILDRPRSAHCVYAPVVPLCGWSWLRCCYFLVHRLLTVADEPIVPNGMSNCPVRRMFTSFQKIIYSPFIHTVNTVMARSNSTGCEIEIWCL